MKTDLEILREEVMRLRERVAVLESQQRQQAQQMLPSVPLAPYVAPTAVPPGTPFYVGDAPGWWHNGPFAASP